MKRGSSKAALCLSALFLVAPAGCQDQPKKPSPSVKPPELPPLPRAAYPDGPEGLHRLWTDILAACRKEKEAEVKRLFKSMAMSREELADLLGTERASALYPAYEQQMLAMNERGAAELVQRVITKKYDEVIPVLIAEQAVEEQTDTEKRLLKALAHPAPIYSVRIKRDFEMKDVRYEFFIYLNGYWRTGSQLSEQLPPVPVQPAATPPESK